MIEQIENNEQAESSSKLPPRAAEEPWERQDRSAIDTGRGAALGLDFRAPGPLLCGRVAMSLQLQSGVSLHPVRLGDRRKTAPGWIIVAQGAVRGILSSGPDGQVLHACACDQRILPPDGLLVFEGLEEVQTWLEVRLPPEPSRTPSPPRAEEPDDDPSRPTPLTLADADRALLAAAIDYCWSLRNRTLPDRGPLRQLWAAFVEFRRLSNSGDRGTK